MKKAQKYRLGFTEWFISFVINEERPDNPRKWVTKDRKNDGYALILTEEELLKMGAKPVEPDEPEFEEIEKLPNGTFSLGYPDDVYAVRISQLIRNQNKLIAKIKELEDK